MPFGFCKTINTFQWKIDLITGDLDFLFAFQDDLEVASPTKEHAPNVEAVTFLLPPMSRSCKVFWGFSSSTSNLVNTYSHC